MYKRELKVNLKSFIIWTTILSLILLLSYAFYPSMDQSISMDEILEMLPEELIIAFNMDIVSVDTAFGWFATEGYVMLALIGSCYASLLGSTILLKEESEKTIEFLMSKPASRLSVFRSKLLAGLTYITAINLILFAVTTISLLLLDSLELKIVLLLSGSLYFIHLIFFFVTFLISLFFTKTKKMIGLSLGLVLGTYFLQIISVINDRIEFLKYFSPFEYFSPRYIIRNEMYNVWYLLLLFLIVSVSVLVSIKVYKNKEFTL